MIAELVMKALMLLANTDLSVEERELLEHLDAVQNDDGTATVYEV